MEIILTDVKDIKTHYLEQILIDVHKCAIKIDKEAKQIAVQLAEEMIKKVKNTFTDSNFPLKDLINGITYRGSYYNGVKVKNPDEFDVDIEIKLPKMDKNKIRLYETEPGFISINIKEAYKDAAKNPTWEDKYRGLKNYMDEKGFLLESTFRSEIESFLTRNLRSGSMNLGGFEVQVSSFKKSGPAFTYRIKYNKLEIDIDFVFVIYFDTTLWAPKPVRKHPVPQNEKSKYFWFAVPKPSDNNRSWRLSFPKQESDYLDSSQNLKFCLRALKALRDAQKWSLCSYHIVTLFLWEAEAARLADKNGNKPFWSQPLSKLFLIMLSKLSMNMKNHEIKFFWHRDCNMIEDTHPDTCYNMHNRIEEFLRNIHKYSENQDALRTYVFKTMYRIEIPNCERNQELMCSANGNKIGDMYGNSPNQEYSCSIS